LLSWQQASAGAQPGQELFDPYAPSLTEVRQQRI